MLLRVGVQEAFYASDRVFTLSFHLHRKGFFPGPNFHRAVSPALRRDTLCFSFQARVQSAMWERVKANIGAHLLFIACFQCPRPRSHKIM